jgi:ketosteroid isomerase-like protein
MTTTTASHTSTVTAMYEAFGRGDLAGILSHLSEDVTWDVTEEPWTPDDAGVPWLKPRHGHDQVAEFFEIVGAWSYERFEVLDILASDTQVAAEIRLIADLPNGNRIDEVVIHMWTFGQDDKVIALRRMLDTAANIAAADVSPPHLPAH